MIFLVFYGYSEDFFRIARRRIVALRGSRRGGGDRAGDSGDGERLLAY